MKQLFLALVLISFFSISAHAQIVNFTNTILKNQLLESNESNGIAKNQLAENIIVDINDDGELSEEELFEVFQLNLNETGLNSMEGLDFMLNLTSLKLEGNNLDDHLVLPELSKVVNLHLYDNPNLISVYGQNLLKLANFYVDENIDSLTLIDCHRLFYISLQNTGFDNLEYLHLDGANRITEVDLSNFNGNKVHLINCNDIETILINQDLINVFHIENLPDLENIDNGNTLTSKDTIIIKDCPLLFDINAYINIEGENYINITNCEQLESVTIYGQGGSGTGSTTVNISNNGQIKSLQLNSINDGIIDLTSMPNIETFDFRYSNFDLVDFGSIDYPNLTFMNLTNTNGTTLDLTNCIALETLWIKGWAIINEFYLPSSNTLQTLKLEGNNNSQELELPIIDFSNCTSLTDINFSYIDIEELSITSSPNLESFDFYYSSVQSLELSNNLLSSLYLGSFGINMESLSVYNCSSLSSISISSDSLNSLEISQLPSLEHLSIYGGQMTDLSIEDIPNLKTISCSNLPLTNLNISNIPALEELYCSTNNLSTLNISNTPVLEELDCSNNNLNSINISNLSQLKVLNCQYNNLETLDLSNTSLIEHLNGTYNNIVDINIENCVNIESLYLNNNSITTLDLNNCQNLITLHCHNNQLENLNLSKAQNLESLNCKNNNLTSLNLSQTNVSVFRCESNQLEFMYIRNGHISNSNTNFSNNPNLSYVCCDHAEINTINNLLNIYGVTNCTVNNNCPAAPGQLNSLLQFGSILDFDNNGCDINTDPIFPFSKFNISGNNYDGTYFSNNIGSGELSLIEGDYTIEQINFSTNEPPIDFTFNSEPDTTTAYFCLVPDSLYFDLEVSIFNTAIRPGFDFTTTIILKNNGVTSVSGVLDFYFEDNYINYNSSSPNYTELDGGFMQWDFEDLIPFESRTYIINFTANTPTDNEYPVNIDDILSFSTLANPTEDDFNPSDNYAGMKSTVVGSYDPNDKTCVEGTTMLPEMIGDYLTYKIRFENTGTYYAENVLIVDIIDTTRFDISTLTPIAGSHDFQTRVTGNKVEFAFDNIFLPFEDDENDGWVLFKIKTLDELIIGQEIKNQAEIYFDYNAPIITNEETTTITEIVNTHTTNESVDFSFYPNPTTDIVNYNSQDQIRLIEIFDINGRLIRSQKENKNTINVEALSAGTYILKVTTNKGSKGFKFNKL